MPFTVMRMQGNVNQWTKLSTYSSEQQAITYAKAQQKLPNTTKVKIVDERGNTTWMD